MFKELRGSARVYQKLDFAYLAAFGAMEFNPPITLERELMRLDTMHIQTS